MKINQNIKFFVNFAKIQSELARKFDSQLGGISMSEFMILLHLEMAEGNLMRRIDLAGKIGLSASGITRLLLPMEKIGLIQKEVDERDARASFVKLSPGGKKKLVEGLERAEFLSQEILEGISTKKIEVLSDTLVKLGGVLK